MVVKCCGKYPVYLLDIHLKIPSPLYQKATFSLDLLLPLFYLTLTLTEAILVLSLPQLHLPFTLHFPLLSPSIGHFCSVSTLTSPTLLLYLFLYFVFSIMSRSTSISTLWRTSCSRATLISTSSRLSSSSVHSDHDHAAVGHYRLIHTL